MEKWIKLYGCVCYIKIIFAESFGPQKDRVYKELSKNSNFIQRGGGGSFSIDESSPSYSYMEYRVCNSFLNNSENRQKLKELYTGKRETLGDDEKNTESKKTLSYRK